jgi:hypothetical protein
MNSSLSRDSPYSSISLTRGWKTPYKSLGNPAASAIILGLIRDLSTSYPPFKASKINESYFLIFWSYNYLD